MQHLTLQGALAANQTSSNETDVQGLDLSEVRERGLDAATFPEADEVCPEAAHTCQKCHQDRP